MPMYVLRCRSCGHEHEVLVRSPDERPGTCPSCGGEAAQVFFPPTVPWFPGTTRSEYREPRRS